MSAVDPRDPLPHWLAAQACHDSVLRFMAHFDAREWAAMEDLVTPDIEWQRPDRTLRGLAELRAVLQATPADVRVRHVITNPRLDGAATEGRAVLHSYFTVYRHTGPLPGPDAHAPLDGAASMGRYRDELVLRGGRWRIARRQTFTDFRRA